MNRILLALDDAPGAEGLLMRARSYAHAQRADLWVVHVLTPKGPGERARNILDDLDEADRWLSRMLRGKSHAERPVVVIGDPAHEIASTAQTIGADAIVLGARPRSRPRSGDATGPAVIRISSCPVVRLAEFRGTTD